MEALKNFFSSEVFFHNIFVMLIFRLIILVIVLRLLSVGFSFLKKKTTANMKNKEQKKQIYTVLSILKSFLELMIVALFLMEVLLTLGIDMRPILATAGVLGVAIGFGAKRMVEDIFSGISLILQGQIQVGDIIEIGDKFGIVEKLNLKLVVLRDWDGKVHYIRNGMIDIVTNYTRDYAFAIIDIGVAYKENVDNVIQTVIEIANNELKTGKYGQYLLGDIEVLGLNKFGESSIDLKFRIKTQTMHQWAITREFNRLIKNKFDEVGIEIPFPQRVVHTEKE